MVRAYTQVVLGRMKLGWVMTQVLLTWLIDVVEHVLGFMVE